MAVNSSFRETESEDTNEFVDVFTRPMATAVLLAATEDASLLPPINFFSLGCEACTCEVSEKLRLPMANELVLSEDRSFIGIAPRRKAPDREALFIM